MTQRNYAVSTTALSLTPSGTTIGSGNTTSSSFGVARTLVRGSIGANEFLSGSQTWSITYVVSAMTTPYEMRLKVQRRNSAGVMQAESGYGSVRSATGTFTDNITADLGTWAANDQLALVWEHRRPSGTGSKNGTLNANGASYVDAPIESPLVIQNASQGQSIANVVLGGVLPLIVQGLAQPQALDGGSLPYVFPGNAILDNFNRTNANPLDGNWVNGYWGDAAVALTSNEISSSGSGWAGAYYNTLFNADQEVYLTLSVIDGSQVNIPFRISGTNILSSPSGYELLINNGQIQISRLDGGSQVDPESGSAVYTATIADGYRVGLSVIGNTIKVYLDTGSGWSLVLSATDTTYNRSGYIGIEFLNNSAHVDDYGGGNATDLVGVVDLIQSSNLAVSNLAQGQSIQNVALSVTGVTLDIQNLAQAQSIVCVQPIVSDAFAAADATPINGRTPDVTVAQRAWTEGNWFDNTVGAVQIQSNKASIELTDSGFGMNIGRNNYILTWFESVPVSGQFRGGTRFRSSSLFGWGGSENYYFITCRFDLGSSQIRFVSLDNGIETVLQDVDHSFSYNTTYRFDLAVDGNTFTLYIDGSFIYQFTDSGHATGNIIGWGAGGVSGQNFTIDSVQIVDPNLVLGQNHVLVISNMAQAQAIENIGLIQNYLLVIQNAAQTQFVEEVNLLTMDVLVVEDQAEPQFVENPVLIQIHNLSPPALLQSQSVQNLVLVQQHVLVIQDLSQAQTLENAPLLEQYNLFIQALSQSQSIESVVLIQNVPLAIQEELQPQSIENLVLVQNKTLFVDELAQGQTAENVDLSIEVSEITLEISNLDQSQVIANIDIVQNLLLSIQNLDQPQSIETVSILQNHILAISDLLQNQSVENIAAIINFLLAIEALSQEQVIENIVVVQQHILSVSSALQAQAIASVQLSITGALGVEGATQNQILDHLSLLQNHNLGTENLSEPQSVESPTLIVNKTLEVQNASQAQFTENAVLSQNYSLIVQEILQGESSTNILLGQNYHLHIDDALQGSLVPNTTISCNYNLVIYELNQTQFIQNIELISVLALAIQDVLQEQSLEGLPLFIQQYLIIQDAIESQTTTDLILLQTHNLQLGDLSQTETLENVILSLANVLTVSDLVQGQALGELSLAQQYLLVTESLSQEQQLETLLVEQLHNLLVGDLFQTQRIQFLIPPDIVYGRMYVRTSIQATLSLRTSLIGELKTRMALQENLETRTSKTGKMYSRQSLSEKTEIRVSTLKDMEL